MQSLLLKKTFKYDGTQLKPLYTYLNYGVLGDSILAWRGPCEVSLENMIDGEDFIQNQRICGDNMLHFIVECFDRELFSGVCLQRIFAALAKDYFQTYCPKAKIIREGDDLYVLKKEKKAKLTISIASRSSVSVMVHFAINITNRGTPVKTASLEDLECEPMKVARNLLSAFKIEFNSIRQATQKVRPLGVSTK